MKFFQKSLKSYLLSVGLGLSFVANSIHTQANEIQGFQYQDRLLFSINAFNLAAEAYNEKGFEQFTKVIGHEFEAEDLKHMELVFQSAIQLPTAYLVGDSQVKFLYVDKRSFQNAGLIVDFSEIEKGIIKFNGDKFSYNQSRTYREWFDLLETGTSDVSSFTLIPEAHAKLGKVLSAFGAKLVSLFGGGKTQKPKAQPAPRVAYTPSGGYRNIKGQTIRAPHRQFYSHASRKAYGSSNIRQDLHSPTRHSINRESSHKGLLVGMSGKGQEARDRRIGYMRGIASSTGSKVASVARARLGYRETSSYPPKNLKCAQQASNILKQAGIINTTHMSVVGLVGDLRSKGWRTSSTPVPGAVAFSNPSLGTKSSRSHIGVVGPDLAVYHNSGAAGGTVIRSERSDNDYNGRWLGGVKYLIPPA